MAFPVYVFHVACCIDFKLQRYILRWKQSIFAIYFFSCRLTVCFVSAPYP
ncbi:hypothetical protein BACUNI_00188 [Bacteroides uniformis ATCC 8492]|uniref:Uncharacterized protein n=1 Tax=Bacteroides uniformis (strain ATCC 8492 / DSM 6597 / CCUG 4942 / CIP 103695 / JCM 5828 / KCTC 5204 / NCTC 13054 / VPI 0061) TaxID=411479 RepID=A0ABC9NHP7_BACUC|nr:hypothetical protein BACUNI_00188 [Bacteroides uniformis ATCC 8492]